MARHGDIYVPVLVDHVDADRLAGHSLSIGSHGYAHATLDGYQQLVHRWLLGLRTGDRRVGDHLNRDKLDNRRGNLRVIDGSLSNANRSQAETARNVYPTRYGRWVAKVKWRRERHWLGTFSTEDDALAAVARWRAEHPETLPPQLDR